MRKVLMSIRGSMRQMKNRILLKRGQIYYIKSVYKARFGKEINLDSPKTFAEKIQWMKLYDHNPKIVLYADKYLV